MSGKAKSTNQENQMISKWRSRALAFAVFLGASASAMAQNAIQSINSTQQAGSEVVRIELSRAARCRSGRASRSRRRRASRSTCRA